MQIMRLESEAAEAGASEDYSRPSGERLENLAREHLQGRVRSLDDACRQLASAQAEWDDAKEDVTSSAHAKEDASMRSFLIMIEVSQASRAHAAIARNDFAVSYSLSPSPPAAAHRARSKKLSALFRRLSRTSTTPRLYWSARCGVA